MRLKSQRLSLLLGWLGTTALAVVLAVGAVGVVSDSVTASRPRPLSPAAVSAALDREAVPTPAPGTPPASIPVAGGPDTVPSTSTTPDSTATTAPNPGTPRTSVTGPASTTTPTGGPDRPGTFPPPEERTYDLVGGSVRVRFADGKAELLAATPNNGFRVIAGDDGPGGNSGADGEVRVRFRSDGHESRLRAYWEEGPQAEIEENRR